MLQPRGLMMEATCSCDFVDTMLVNRSDILKSREGRRMSKMATGGHPSTLKSVALLVLVLMSVFADCQGLKYDDDISAERVKRQSAGEGDVTTVLLVDNQKLNRDINSRNGRYLNVKPVIGLLTSTARTFIQDGVTTEYATQVLGTTLDNGRVYAQLLTKSSLVLYDRPHDAQQEKRTRLAYEADDGNRWNLEENLGERIKDQYIIKNTDYISPKDNIDLFTVFASKPSQESLSTAWNPVSYSDIRAEEAIEKEIEQITENSRVQGLKEIPRFTEFEAFNFLDPLPAARERKISTYNTANFGVVQKEERKEKAIDYKADTKENLVKEDMKSQQQKIIEPSKVNPGTKLPTFTVKNEFSPIFYYIDNVESKTEKSNTIPNYLKNAKKLFGHKEEQKPLKTLTYYGFSNFTTTVGDIAFIFSPTTTNDFKIGGPQDITPSAASEVQPNVATRVKTYLSSDLNMVTKTMQGHQLYMETAIPTVVMSPQDANRASKALHNGEAKLKNVLYERPMEEEEQGLKQDEKFSRVIASLKSGLFIRQHTPFGLNRDSIQPSESSYSTIQRIHSTDKLSSNEETVQDERILGIHPTEPLGTLSPTTTTAITESIEEVSVVTEPYLTTAAEEEITEPSTTTESDAETSPITEETLTTPALEIAEDEKNVIEEPSQDATCTGGIIPVSTMTTAYKTFTYLTTYFIPLEGTETTTSVKSHEVVTSETGFLTNLECKTEEVLDIVPTKLTELNLPIKPTQISKLDSEPKETTVKPVEEITEASLPVLTTSERTTDAPVERTTTEAVETTTDKVDITTKQEERVVDTTTTKAEEESKTENYPTTERIVTTSESHMEMSVTTEESVPTINGRFNIETTTESKDDSENSTNSDENEIDLIFKTLYTTYTYFTTYFQGSTSTIASTKSVVTNVITSTLDLSEIDPSIFNAIESSDYLFKGTQREVLGEIMPTSVGVGRPTETFALNSIIDLVKNRQVIESVQNDAISSSKISTPELNNDKLFEEFKPDVVKTFYTTYTFFTTLYVEQDINICSRSEVYTNYVGPASLIPTKTSEVIMKTKVNEIDFNNCKKVSADKIATMKNIETDKNGDEVAVAKPKYNVYTSIDRSNKKNKSEEEDTESKSDDEGGDIDLKSGESMLVTDIKSSFSKGDRQIIDNAVLDDQVSSESNIDEIMPSPTLLLQTSFTTFTYFTTMYVGKDSSKVKSRLETVTNVVTETLDSKSAEVEETNLPITYYTTFTYWTTLYKDKSTTITSREDIISNVVTPTVSPTTVSPIETSPIEVSVVQVAKEINETKVEKTNEVPIKPSTTVDDILADDGKATFFTTYTYFTTYYVGNTSELRSSLETITNIVDNTKDLVNENQIGRAVGKEPAVNNLLNDDDKKSVIKATAIPGEIIPTKVVGDNAIIPTQLSGTYVDKLPDGEKRILSSQVAIISGDSTIITGGEIRPGDVGKVEIITSTKTVDGLVVIDSKIATTGSTDIEGSVTDPTTLSPDDEDGEGEEDEEEEDDEDDDGTNPRKKSRLTFSTRKRTFTPVIRPFASRNRPTFSPKRVQLTSGATTITRSDFTPTVTATPALKSSGFNRKQPSSAYPGSTAGGARRGFNRVNGATPAVNAPSARSTGFRRSSAGGDIQPTSSRRGGFRTGAVRNDFSTRAGSRIRPTLSSRFRGSKQTTTPSLNGEDLATVTENPTAGTEDGETSTEPGARKTTNALNRFRRPPFTRAPVGAAPRTTTQGTTRRGSFGRNGRGGTTTTTKATQRTTQNPLFALRNRARPNSLFPPRGLINKPTEPPQEDEINDDQQFEEEDKEEGEEEGANEDSDYESSDREESVATTLAPKVASKVSNTPVIKPFGFRRRSKRQTDYGARRNFANFRRPSSRTPKSEPKVEPEPEIEVVTQAPRTRGRFSSRSSTAKPSSQAKAPQVKPAPQVKAAPQAATRVTATTKSPANGRKPFILRGDSSKKTSQTTSRPSFKSRSGRPSSARTSSSSPINLRPKAPRLKTYATSQTEAPRAKPSSSSSSSRSRTTNNRGRGTTARYRPTNNDIVDNNLVNYQIPDDGKLTITHKIPIEVTIPVVNGKLTEYKNVLTAKPSIEILQPDQWSTTVNSFGSKYTVLVSELSEPVENGATKVVQFILHETPTTSVVFTPTTIRGRRTSFSHVIPSTVYDVERVTSTVQPSINANVPLANILLSQLLLGGIGMPQPQINPLLAFQGQQGVPQTPMTEFKVRTTTYVTTVTDAKSTVIPITFRGKEIFTTIIDSKVDVITATEFITETVVVTPTVGLPGQNPNQLNSILLLLQQQQVQQVQQQQLQTANPLLGLQTDPNVLQNNRPLFADDLLNSPKPEVLNVKNADDYLSDYVEEDITQAPKRAIRRKPKPNTPIPPRQSSIITLYVSGRTPGEFSTVLSTVYMDETQSVQKREAIFFENYEVIPFDIPPLVDSSQYDLMLEKYILPTTDDSLMSNTISQSETQSLESILGEVSRYVATESPGAIAETADAAAATVYVIEKSVRDQGR